MLKTVPVAYWKVSSPQNIFYVNCQLMVNNYSFDAWYTACNGAYYKTSNHSSIYKGRSKTRHDWKIHKSRIKFTKWQVSKEKSAASENLKTLEDTLEP